MLNAQVVVNLPLKFGVGMNLVRHGNFLNEGSSRKAVRCHTPSYRWQLRCSYCACAGFLIATLGLLRNTSFEIDFIVKHEPPHHRIAARPEPAHPRQEHPFRGRNRIHPGSEDRPGRILVTTLTAAPFPGPERKSFIVSAGAFTRSRRCNQTSSDSRVCSSTNRLKLRRYFSTRRATAPPKVDVSLNVIRVMRS